MFQSADVLWTLWGAAMVFFMQAGFALCEGGLTRAKNTGNILMKNLMDLCIGAPCYWLVGFGLMFGGAGLFIGKLDPAVLGSYDFGTLPTLTYFIFQTVFCATAATIVSGSMAERTNFKAYCIYSALISLIIYPISGHWIWGGGWLAQLESLTNGFLPAFHDFAGSTCVHMVGGVTALVGAKILGARIGKYDKQGKPRAIPGHNLMALALGVFILWFAWYGFNGASTVALTEEADMISASLVFVNTTLAPAVASIAAMAYTWIRYGKPDVSMTFNGTLAGLVAITAGCDAVSPLGSVIIGLGAGILVCVSVEFLDKKLKIDDPVGAISVHGTCGAFGTICVGLFATEGGLFYGDGANYFLTQIIGVAAVIIWVLVSATIVFKIIDKAVKLRVPAQVEIDGLDYHEHGLASAYSGFSITDVSDFSVEANENTDLGEDNFDLASDAQKNAAVKVTKTETVGGENVPEGYRKVSGMNKVSIIAPLAKFDALKKSMNDLGVTGMTATQVMGSGIERGAGSYYRGVETDATLIPKIKIEIVVGSIPVDDVIETAKKTLYTGHIGDGKIFVYAVDRVVKIRTGEEDFAALADVE